MEYFNQVREARKREQSRRGTQARRLLSRRKIPTGKPLRLVETNAAVALQL
jgi:hypothetical protein